MAHVGVRSDPLSAIFWNKWYKIVPKSPYQIRNRQLQLARYYYKDRTLKVKTRSGLTPRDRKEERFKHRVSEAIKDGFPEEALSKDVLSFVYESFKVSNTLNAVSGMVWQSNLVHRLAISGIDEVYLEGYRSSWSIK